jgi:hypothetical protein
MLPDQRSLVLMIKTILFLVIISYMSSGSYTESYEQSAIKSKRTKERFVGEAIDLVDQWRYPLPSMS